MILNLGYTVRFWNAEGDAIMVGGTKVRYALTRDEAYAMVFALGDEAMDKGAVTADIGATEILELHRG